MAGVLKIISFLPKDVELFKQNPSKRRKFIDSNLSMIDTKYLRLLSEYNRYLNEIRELVKSDNYDEVTLDVLIEELSKRGFILLNKRKQFISWINEKLNDISQYLFNEKDIFKINLHNMIKK